MKAPEWVRRRARWLLRDEIRQVNADLAIARADALDAILARDGLMRRFATWAGSVSVKATLCTKVRLHSPDECAAWALLVAESTMQAAEDFEPYECGACTHPVATIWHVRHTDPVARGGVRGRVEAQRGRSLQTRIADDRLREIRMRLTNGEHGNVLPADG